jgi:predicted transcriptional regulator
MATQIVSAYVTRNQLPTADVGPFIGSVYKALAQLHVGEPATEEKKPYVNPKKSIFDDYLVCLHDGKHLTMLKRYLRTHYNQSPEEYRKQFDLPIDYPMVAPAYARLRSEFAKNIGLGRVSTRGKGKPKK